MLAHLRRVGPLTSEGRSIYQGLQGQYPAHPVATGSVNKSLQSPSNDESAASLLSSLLMNTWLKNVSMWQEPHGQVKVSCWALQCVACLPKLTLLISESQVGSVDMLAKS